jgi:hypothetical protein
LFPFPVFSSGTQIKTAMKKTYLFLILLASVHLASAQYLWDAGIKTGASNYLGDIGGNGGTRRDFVPDMKLSETKFSAGAFARYKVHRDFALIASYNYGRIAGDDKLSSNPARRARNLSFRNDIHELSIMGEYYFFSINDLGHTYRYRNSFKAYVGLGVAGFYHDPQTYYEGQWIDLRPLKTEGENTPYSKFCVAIPASLGCFFTLNRRYRIGWDMCWRKTFTDYLDDISGNYANPKNLSPEGAALANRTNELPISQSEKNNYLPGMKRGDPTHKDSYVFTTINCSYVFRGHSRESWRNQTFRNPYWGKRKVVKARW